MNDEGHSCNLSLSCAGPAPPSPSLAEVLQRFKKQARPGVCATAHYRCPFFTWGSGPPLLFVPGLSSDARSFILLMAHLAEQFRCIAYDLPTGRDDGAKLSAITHVELVDDVFSLLDHLSIRQSYVLGASFGSTIALAAMQARPERLPRALLQAGFARRPLAPAERLLARLARYWHRPMRDVPGFKFVMRRIHFGPFTEGPSDGWHWLLDRCGASPVAAVGHRAWLMHQLDLRPNLGDIRQPILLVGGDMDPSANRGCEAELLNGLPNADRIELSHCGHYPQISHAAVLAEVVGRFLTPTGAPLIGK